MAIVLTVIAVVAGGILAYVNSVTAPQIEKINADNLANGIKEVMGGGEVQVADPETQTATIGGKEKTFEVYAVSDASGKVLGNAVQTSENGFGGNLKVLVGFDPEGTILGYTILEHAETPGLLVPERRQGQHHRHEPWQEQLHGKQRWWRSGCYHGINHHLPCIPVGY